MSSMSVFGKNAKGVSDIYCPQCSDTLLHREYENYSCMKCGFQSDYRGLQEMSRHGTALKMQRKIHPEPQPDGTVSQAVYVRPETWENLRRKHPENLMHTLSDVFDGLAANGVVITFDEDARKLRAMGINNGAQMVTAMETARMVEAERNQLISTLGLLKGSLDQFRAQG